MPAVLNAKLGIARVPGEGVAVVGEPLKEVVNGDVHNLPRYRSEWPEMGPSAMENEPNRPGDY
ncbi:hypothetical protein [Kitasatospora sp. NPDC096140]|uniref:hypothetical protein n=1 Tax=Kitasatospora sp. NPDC096140 TaxID=3155425 RepID=UPI003334956F